MRAGCWERVRKGIFSKRVMCGRFSQFLQDTLWPVRGRGLYLDETNTWCIQLNQKNRLKASVKKNLLKNKKPEKKIPFCFHKIAKRRLLLCPFTVDCFELLTFFCFNKPVYFWVGLWPTKNRTELKNTLFSKVFTSKNVKHLVCICSLIPLNEIICYILPQEVTKLIEFVYICGIWFREPKLMRTVCITGTVSSLFVWNV